MSASVHERIRFTWTMNAQPVLLKNFTGRGHKDGTATIRPSDFPEEDFWTTEEQTMARRALPAHIVPRTPSPAS